MPPCSKPAALSKAYYVFSSRAVEVDHHYWLLLKSDTETTHIHTTKQKGKLSSYALSAFIRAPSVSFLPAGESKKSSKMADEKPDIKNEPITIKVKTATGEETVFKVKRSTKFSKIFEAYSKKTGQNIQSLRFAYNGDRVDEVRHPIIVGSTDDVATGRGHTAIAFFPFILAEQHPW
jgi:Ubiquitin-2 like Rad60 SUMO-like